MERLLFFVLSLFTFKFLVTASEPCSDSSESCVDGTPVKGGSELLQRSQSSSKTLKTASASFARARELGKRSKLVIEKNFKSFDSSHYKSFNKELSCMENVEEGFDHLVTRSSLDQELTPVELQDFRARVIEEMEILCKHDAAGGHVEYMQDFMQALEDERPLLTQRLEEILQEQYHEVSFEFAEWLANFSKMDLQHRTGSQPPHENRTLLLETSRSIVERMKKRTLPANFDARSHWPECGEIIGRIHNQGQCGSCWAFGALSAVDSRLCISTNGLFSGPSAQIARGFVTSCTYESPRDGCQGGWPSDVFRFLDQSGSPTSGDAGCSPYFGHGEGTEHFAQTSAAPPCPTECSNTGCSRTLHEDRFNLGLSTYLDHPRPRPYEPL
eukprot:s4530_g8.t1